MWKMVKNSTVLGLISLAASDKTKRDYISVY
jgi:hypothetical protein